MVLFFKKTFILHLRLRTIVPYFIKVRLIKMHKKAERGKSYLITEILMKDSGNIIQFRAKEYTHKNKISLFIKDNLGIGKNRGREN